jgi:hypothetical protein
MNISEFLGSLVKTRYSHFQQDDSVINLSEQIDKEGKNWKILPSPERIAIGQQKAIEVFAGEISNIFNDWPQDEHNSFQIELENYIEVFLDCVRLNFARLSSKRKVE